MNHLRIAHRPATQKHKSIGRGVLSGNDGKARIVDILSEGQIRVFYSDFLATVSSREEWDVLPEIGVQVVTSHGGVIKGFDEYRYHGDSPKYGLYLSDDEFEAILEEAMSLAKQDYLNG